MNCVGCKGFVERIWQYCPKCGCAQGAYGDGMLHIMGGLSGAAGGIVGMTEEIQRRPGLKLDEHKAKVYTGVFMSFPHALEDIARKTIEGCGEPGHVLHGWKEVPEGFKRYSESFGRHVLGEGKAVGPVQLHDAMVTTCWNDLARLEHHHLDAMRNGYGETGANCQQAQRKG